MVKNNNGGNKQKKIARKSDQTSDSKELLLADNVSTLYGQVTSIHGGGMFQVLTIDGFTHLGHIRGKDKIGLRRRNNYITIHCWVLVSLRGLTNKKDEDCDLEHKYSDLERTELKQMFPMLNWNIFDENERKSFSGFSSSSAASHADVEFSHDAVMVDYTKKKTSAKAVLLHSNPDENDKEEREEEDLVNIDDI
jgi:translation initiation factor IF-1